MKSGEKLWAKWELMRFLMQIVLPPLINVPWAQKPWIYSKNGISCSKTVPIHSNKSCSPSTNLYARKCFSLPGWLPGFAAQYTRTLVYLLLKKTLVCCEDIILIDRTLFYIQTKLKIKSSRSNNSEYNVYSIGILCHSGFPVSVSQMSLSMPGCARIQVTTPIKLLRPHI